MIGERHAGWRCCAPAANARTCWSCGNNFWAPQLLVRHEPLHLSRHWAKSPNVQTCNRTNVGRCESSDQIHNRFMMRQYWPIAQELIDCWNERRGWLVSWLVQAQTELPEFRQSSFQMVETCYTLIRLKHLFCYAFLFRSVFNVFVQFVYYLLGNKDYRKQTAIMRRG